MFKKHIKTDLENQLDNVLLTLVKKGVFTAADALDAKKEKKV
jgi:hypothetical protein